MYKRYKSYRGDKEYNLKETTKYTLRKQEMDKEIEIAVAPYIDGKRLTILDAGCGVGHLTHLLHSLSPSSSFIAIDQADFLIKEAKKLYGAKPNCQFVRGDIEDYAKDHKKSVDISISRAVLSWVPYYENFLRALFRLTREHIFLTSLFYEGDIDFITQVREFRSNVGKRDFTEYRNVYSLPRFERFARKLGGKAVTVNDFDIGIDLSKGPVDRLGTYTVRLEGGKRLQISGAVLMNWKTIRIDI